MHEGFESIRQLLDRVRSRWRRLVLLGGIGRAAAAGAVVLLAAFALARLMPDSPAALAVIALVAVFTALAAFVRALWPARRIPSNHAVARFIEEREPSLDDRLLSAVDVATATQVGDRPALAQAMVADATRAAASVDPASIVPDEDLRRHARRAVAAAAALLIALIVTRHSVRQAYAGTLLLFPSHITLDVMPGDTNVQAGSGLTVRARLVGNTAPVVAQLLRMESGSDDWQPIDMTGDGVGQYKIGLTSLTRAFRYKVRAGAVESPAFAVSVQQAPRVGRIDVEYDYPRQLRLAPRFEEDGGDIYGPEGTDVTVTVHTDAPVTAGRMVLGPDAFLTLTPQSPTALRGALRITGNGSYRLALEGAGGMKSSGDTEYFIRILDDRPPEVHIVRPASDRRVTRLEEVEIAAEAQDDFGISAVEFVYAVRGGAEHVVPLGIPSRSTAVTGRYVLYLEDLDLSPGDLVSYYVRARDLPRGKRPSESRSDIFFLEVKPFEEEFTLAQTQAAMGGGSGNVQLDDLVTAQKEIVVATWKLDRRSRDAQGARSVADIEAVAKSEGDLKLRVEQTSSGFRESAMRDPRPARPQNGRPGISPPSPPRAPGTPPVGQSLPEEDAMTRASSAMGKAVTSLKTPDTAGALPQEMEALNALLKAQADVKTRQIQRQQAGGNGGTNRSTEDLSSLFDKELARHQQTNYENQTTAEPADDRNASALDRVKELARRQDELVRRQQQFAREQNRMSADEARRQLETLTREQNELRERAEQLAGQLRQQGGRQGDAPGSQGDRQQQLREITDQMRTAASELRQEDANRASTRGAQALRQLQDLERQLEAGTAEGRRRALGDLQLEARQLADAQRQIAGQSGRPGGGPANGDSLRRLAGEQDRLADRLQRVQEGLRQAAAPGSAPGAETRPDQLREETGLQQAASEAARQVEVQRLAERMRESSEAMRGSAAASPSIASPAQAPDRPASASTGAASQSRTQQDIATALDRVADRLALADTPRDDDSRRMTEQSGRARELRNRINELTRQLEELDGQASGQPQDAAQGNAQSNGSTQQSGRQGQQAQAPGASRTATSADQVRADLDRQMREVNGLLNETRSEVAGSQDSGTRGPTFEGQGMVLSAPGTEAFKQDFSKWQELARQATLALDAVEASLSKKLQDKTEKERLASSTDERAPAEYENQVESYFKALAAGKRP